MFQQMLVIVLIVNSRISLRIWSKESCRCVTTVSQLFDIVGDAQ